MDLSAHFGEFYRASGDRLHCTAHSHHPWPDVTRAAQLAYWDDAVRLTDRKWDKIFGEVVPEAQGHIARHLRLPDPAQIALAPNTHEFVVRLYSCLDWSRPQRVLTTAHEFHSFARQTRRLEETGRLSVTRVSAEPFADFVDRFWDEHPVKPTLAASDAPVILHGHCHQKALWGDRTSAQVVVRYASSSSTLVSPFFPTWKTTLPCPRRYGSTEPSTTISTFCTVKPRWIGSWPPDSIRSTSEVVEPPPATSASNESLK